MVRREGMVPKGWGYELIWATNEKYCGKILVFEKTGSKTSMHFNKEKHKSWFVNNGKFILRWMDLETATMYTKELNEGDTWVIEPLVPQQLEALQDNSSITEVSTSDSIEDVYRIIPGDSQTGRTDQSSNDNS